MEDGECYVLWARVPKRSLSSALLLDWLEQEQVAGPALSVLASLRSERYEEPRLVPEGRIHAAQDLEARQIEELLSKVYEVPA